MLRRTYCTLAIKAARLSIAIACSSFSSLGQFLSTRSLCCRKARPHHRLSYARRVQAHTYTHTRIHTFKHNIAVGNVDARSITYIHTYLDPSTHSQSETLMHIQAHASARNVGTHKHTHTLTHKHTHICACKHTFAVGRVDMYVCVCGSVSRFDRGL